LELDLNIFKKFSIEFQVKKESLFQSGGPRFLKFAKDSAVIVGDVQMKPSGKTCTIAVKPGQPNTSSNHTNLSLPYFSSHFDLRVQFSLLIDQN
jgi:hypothetical protein